MQPTRAAVVQYQHDADDKARNLRIIRDMVADAAAREVQLLVFPEMCITGYWHVRTLTKTQIEALAEPVPNGPSCRALRDMARDTGITIGAGLIEKTADGALANAYVLAMPDGHAVVHRKLHCFISEHMTSGNQFTLVDIPGIGRAGILICYDNNIGENVRINALRGAEILIAPHQTGGCATPSPHCMGAIDPELWERRRENPEAIEAQFRGPKGREWLLTWLPARAHDNGLFLLFSNGVGQDDNEVRTGNAMILDPYGRILAETWKAGNDMVVADLDPALRDMCTGSRWIRSRRPELYDELTRPTGREQDTRAVRFETGRPKTNG